MNRRAVLPSLYNFVRILLSYYTYFVVYLVNITIGLFV